MNHPHAANGEVLALSKKTPNLTNTNVIKTTKQRTLHAGLSCLGRIIDGEA
jgi:hypothetical protein